MLTLIVTVRLKGLAASTDASQQSAASLLGELRDILSQQARLTDELRQVMERIASFQKGTTRVHRAFALNTLHTVIRQFLGTAKMIMEDHDALLLISWQTDVAMFTKALQEALQSGLLSPELQGPLNIVRMQQNALSQFPIEAIEDQAWAVYVSSLEKAATLLKDRITEYISVPL